MRRQLFLNHATPEDNQFTAWLAAKLTLAGYEVWCDFHRLKGGQDFWEVIEDTIRNKSACFLAITSKRSQAKTGVQKELALALTVEKNLPDFVIPVRIDDIGFDDLKITVHRKNVIDFFGNWQKGLRSLLSTLDEAKIPRTETSEISVALPWLVPDAQLPVKLLDRAETLETNWIEIRSIPEVLSTVQIAGSMREIYRTDENASIPWFQLGPLICGFAPQTDLTRTFATTCPTTSGARVLLSVFLDGKAKAFPGMEHADASRLIVRLLRQAWGAKMNLFGLRPFSVAGKLAGWFIPNERLPANKKTFVDSSGKKRTKNLVGRSEKHRVYWHFGVSTFVYLDFPRRFELRIHIVFTENGVDPISSDKRMHRLRRSFCRNWWNDHFRSLLRAFLAFVSEDTGQIVLPTGGTTSIVMSAIPIEWSSPVSLSDTTDLPGELVSELDEDADLDADREDDEEEESREELDSQADDDSGGRKR